MNNIPRTQKHYPTSTPTMSASLGSNRATHEFSFRSKALRSILAATAICLTTSAASAAVINGVDFTTVYTGSVLPNNASPAWTADLSGSPVVTANSPSAGILTIDTSSTGSAAYYQIASPAWNGSTPTTIEFSLKVNSVAVDAYAAANIYLSSGSIDYRIFFTGNSVLFGDIGGTPSNPTGNYATYAFDTSAANTYRLVVDGGVMSLYINNSTTAAVSGYAGTAPVGSNVFGFGDGSGTVSGVSEWSYVAFTNGGAFAPVPEPATVGLLLGALAVVALGRRRRLQTA